MRASSIALCAVAAAVMIAAATAAPAADEVTSLPGWSKPLPSKQYSGYLLVDQLAGRNLHYWHVQSEKDPANDPVVLWLNGGPGCSSLDGYLYEQGPFHVNETDHTQLYYNEYTWAKVANMIFLEAPAGVGFSYAESPLPTTNDTQTANDNYAALRVFFEDKFPELAKNDFYIAGESYAGVYVPTLALRIHKGNAVAPADQKINLKGIAVGNGCTGTEVGTCSPQGTSISVEFLHDRALYSDATYTAIQTTCKDLANPSAACQALLTQMGNEIGNVDIYDIYAPCINGDVDVDAVGRSNPKTMFNHAVRDVIGGPNGCIDAIAAGAYLNTAAVQEAIHVADAKKYFKQWQVCSGSINYQPNTPNEPRDVYPTLVANYRVLIFEGDVDACVPINGIEAWTTQFALDNKLPVKTPWKPWTLMESGNPQVGGYLTEWTTPNKDTQFAFITIKGAGHMVPEYQPQAALAFFSNFLAGNDLA